MITFPSVCSRTLDPTGKSLVTIVGMHDRQITDADINLIQSLQDYKRQRLLSDQVTSGCLTYSPFQFAGSVPNTFYVPAFDILFNGEVLSIQGSNSSALTLNAVTFPQPTYWTAGTQDEDARLFIAFVEVWYQSLNPQTGQGYYIDPITNLRYFFPYGGVNPSTTNAEVSPDDSVDPFQGLFTTERAQIQWRINVQRVGLNYDFTKFQFGLDPSTAAPSYPGIPMAVYAQASRPAPISSSSIYQFTNMGNINGDTGVWRAGDGNVFNSLGTMDGYSYAFPLAVFFQKNFGNFDIVNNLWGCANATPPYTIPAGQVNGLLSSGISGRYDTHLADQVFSDKVVDTRSTIDLSGWDLDALCRYGFGDLVQGKTQLAISRGDPTISPRSAEACGSELNYYVSVNPTSIANTNTLGAWDGFSNGFSSDLRTFTSTLAVSINNKSLGSNGQPWVSGVTGDAFTISLPTTSKATIQSIGVTALVTNSVTNTKAPAALLQGQVSISGLGSTSVTVQLTKALGGTPFDPGANPIYATIGVQYPAGSGVDLRHVPVMVDGGVLFDSTSGITLPVYGVSEYDVQSQQLALQAYKVFTINPEYSDTQFGTRIWIQIPGSSGTPLVIGNSTLTVFTIPRSDLNESVSGLYGVTAWNLVTGVNYPISNRVMNGSNFVLTIAA